MLRLSLSDLALRIKILKLDLGGSIEDVLCRALDPPVPRNVQRAIQSLIEVQSCLRARALIILPHTAGESVDAK